MSLITHAVRLATFCQVLVWCGSSAVDSIAGQIEVTTLETGRWRQSDEKLAQGIGQGGEQLALGAVVRVAPPQNGHLELGWAAPVRNTGKEAGRYRVRRQLRYRHHLDE